MDFIFIRFYNFFINGEKSQFYPYSREDLLDDQKSRGKLLENFTGDFYWECSWEWIGLVPIEWGEFLTEFKGGEDLRAPGAACGGSGPFWPGFPQRGGTAFLDRKDI